MIGLVHRKQCAMEKELHSIKDILLDMCKQHMTAISVDVEIIRTLSSSDDLYLFANEISPAHKLKQAVSSNTVAYIYTEHSMFILHFQNSTLYCALCKTFSLA